MNDTKNSLNTHIIGTEKPNGTPVTTTDPLWTVGEVADYLKLQPETVRGMARRGKLPGIKIGKVWRFRKSAINQLFQE